MHTIATLTLKPTLDVSTATERVVPTHKLRCGPARYDPGGGGVNVARVIKILGGNVTAVYAAGGPLGEILRNSLDMIGLDQRVITISGMTGQSFTVDESTTGKQYRFVLRGPEMLPGEARQCLDTIAALDPRPAYLVVSGGFPPNVAAPALSEEIVELAERIGARLVLDTSQAMRHAPPHGVFLMKPNAEELSAMLGRACDTREQQIAAASALVKDGRATIVVVSLGAEGALLVTETLVEYFPAPSVEVRSAVGAGDTMVGAIVLALDRGWRLTDAVRYGVAAGAATLMTPGTELCHREDVERLFSAVAAAPAEALL